MLGIRDSPASGVLLLETLRLDRNAAPVVKLPLLWAAVESGSRRSRGCCVQPSCSTTDETSVGARARICYVDRKRAMGTIGLGASNGSQERKMSSPQS